MLPIHGSTIVTMHTLQVAASTTTMDPRNSRYFPIQVVVVVVAHEVYTKAGIP